MLEIFGVVGTGVIGGVIGGGGSGPVVGVVEELCFGDVCGILGR